jgi:hypothetical protein
MLPSFVVSWFLLPKSSEFGTIVFFALKKSKKMLDEFLQFLGLEPYREETDLEEMYFQGFCAFSLLTMELIPIDGKERFLLNIYPTTMKNQRFLVFEIDQTKYILRSVDQEYRIQKDGFPPTLCFQLNYCQMLIYPNEQKSAKYLKRCSKKMSEWLRDAPVTLPPIPYMDIDLCPLLELIREEKTQELLVQYRVALSGCRPV